MPADKDAPIRWKVYAMIVSRLQVNYTVKEAFHWTTMTVFNV